MANFARAETEHSLDGPGGPAYTEALTTARDGAATQLPARQTPHERLGLMAAIGGHGWTAFLQLLAVPVLLRLLGVESYGLLGFYVALQGLAQILDLGLSPTINREMARAEASGGGDRARDLLRTVEIGYWLLGIILGAALALAAPLVASKWLEARSLAPAVVERNLRLMGVLLALQWPLSMYAGGLTGLRRLVPLHLTEIVVKTVATGGGVLLLFTLSRTLEAFLAWQIVATCAYAVALAVLLHRYMPPIGRAARVDLAALRSVWRFAAGMAGLTLTGMAIAQADKIVLSRLLPLAEFGRYTLAATLGAGLYVIILPIFNTMFPMLCARVAARDAEGERETYRLAMQLEGALVVPVGVVAALFSRELIAVWTGDVQLATQVAPIAALLLIGTAINGIMNPPYALQLAHGWTRLGLWLNLGLLALLLPVLVILTPRAGAVGAAGAWVGLNAIYLVVGLPLTHRRLLVGTRWRSLFADVARPTISVTAVALAGRMLATRLELAPLGALVVAAMTFALALVAGIAAAPRARGWLSARLRRTHGAEGALQREPQGVL